MDDGFNTAAGWTLFAGIIALGGTIVSGKYFHHDPVTKGGYEVVDSGGGESGGAAKPTNFAAGDPAKGAEIFKKCVSCHTIAAGGPGGIGPNLHGIMGKKHGAAAGFAYSSALLEKGASWNWETMDQWLASPRKYANGTKMSFAGLSSPEDRASVIRYINEQGSNMPVPAAPAAETAAAPADAAAPAADAAANAAAPAEAAAK